MNFKTTYTLFGILAVFLVAFALTQIFKGKEEDTTGFLFPSLQGDKVKSEEIDRVDIERFAPKLPAEKLVCAREGKHWMLEQPAIRLDGTTIEQAITNVMRAARK